MLVEWVIGVGIVAMLFQINRQLGCIKTELKHVMEITSDHENRLRKGGL